MHSVSTEEGFSTPVTWSAAVAQELRRMIRSGELAPSTPLRQVEIAKRFGVSTTPVREAFATLAKEGLVRQDSHRGVVVFAPSAAELVELYEIRGLLEPLATELAAPWLTDDALAELAEIVDQMREAEPEHHFALNRDFHSGIYAAADRPRLAAMIDGLRDASTAYLRMTVDRYDAAYTRQAHEEHEAILRALQEREASEAADLVRSHLDHNAAHVAGLLAK
jgi:DNA-binding GntR family transcriptional regulator